MFHGVWCGEKIPKNNRVLILGESHYIDKSEATGNEAEFTTTGVICYYLENHPLWGAFFDKIAESFGYKKSEREDFYSRIFFGNYVEELCGVKDDRAEESIKTRRDEYNDSLFSFINEKKIDIVVCFSKRVYWNLPSLADSSENSGKELLGKLGEKQNTVEFCNYAANIEHPHCHVKLQNPLTVYAFGHPSAAGGFRAEQVYEYCKNIKLLDGCINPSIYPEHNQTETEKENPVEDGKKITTLSKKELHVAVRNHPDVLYFYKVFKIISIIFVITILTGLFTVLPVAVFALIVYILMLLVFCICSFAVKHRAKKAILKNGVENAYSESRIERNARLRGKSQAQQEQRKVQNEMPPKQAQRTNRKNVQSVLNNPVVGVTASYAIGKKVQETNKETARKMMERMEKNRYHPTIPESVQKYSTNSHSCANCRYYNCQRELHSQMIVIKRSSLDRNGKAFCGKISGTSHQPNDGINCRSWEKQY